MNDTKTLTEADLAQFTGSEHWYRHATERDVLYTDGVSTSSLQPRSFRAGSLT